MGKFKKETIKVVWICHFSNEEIRNNLCLSKFKLQNALREKLKKNKFFYRDFAPWITMQIMEFEKLPNVELHIISPHKGMKKLTQQFEIRGVRYYFFKPEIPLSNIEMSDLGIINHSYLLNRYFVGGFINRIKPDIVNLIGAENPYYAITALDIKDIPIYITCQTVYSNPLRKKIAHQWLEFNWNLEVRLHKMTNYFGCAGRMHRDLVVNNNANAIVFKYFFPIKRIKEIQTQNKRFDFVFFAAALSKKKGVEDAILGFYQVTKSYPNATLAIVGKSNDSYKIKLLNQITKLGLIKSITFKDFFPIHEDMYKFISQARFAVLPGKLDVISSTIIEAITLGLPVITYKTTGTPYLNKDGEAILIAELNNISELSNNMLRILREPELQKSLLYNATTIVKNEFDNSLSAKRLLENYYSVIYHFQHGIEIDKDQMFCTDEFPLYN